jgi:hypothetical protein
MMSPCQFKGCDENAALLNDLDMRNEAGGASPVARHVINGWRGGHCGKLNQALGSLGSGCIDIILYRKYL